MAIKAVLLWVSGVAVGLVAGYAIGSWPAEPVVAAAVGAPAAPRAPSATRTGTGMGAGLPPPHQVAASEMLRRAEPPGALPHAAEAAGPGTAAPPGLATLRPLALATAGAAATAAVAESAEGASPLPGLTEAHQRATKMLRQDAQTTSREALSRERIDPEWGPATEAALTTALARLGPPVGLTVSSVACRKSTCEVAFFVNRRAPEPDLAWQRVAGPLAASQVVGSFSSASAHMDEGGDPIPGLAYLSWPTRK